MAFDLLWVMEGWFLIKEITWFVPAPPFERSMHCTPMQTMLSASMFLINSISPMGSALVTLHIIRTLASNSFLTSVPKTPPCCILLNLTEVLDHRKSTRSLRSNCQDLLMQPSYKTKTYGDRVFSVCAWRSWTLFLCKYVDLVQFHFLRKNSRPLFLLNLLTLSLP